MSQNSLFDGHDRLIFIDDHEKKSTERKEHENVPPSISSESPEPSSHYRFRNLGHGNPELG